MTDPHGERSMADVWWWGKSKGALSRFPDKVKQNLGYSLRLLQQGEEPTDYRPLPSVGKGLFELRDQDKDGWYRVIYLSRTNDVIHVVHAFEKDTGRFRRTKRKWPVRISAQ
jgi:phage-related protein